MQVSDDRIDAFGESSISDKIVVGRTRAGLWQASTDLGGGRFRVATEVTLSAAIAAVFEPPHGVDFDRWIGRATYLDLI